MDVAFPSFRISRGHSEPFGVTCGRKKSAQYHSSGSSEGLRWRGIQADLADVNVKPAVIGNGQALAQSHFTPSRAEMRYFPECLPRRRLLWPNANIFPFMRILKWRQRLCCLCSVFFSYNMVLFYKTHPKKLSISQLPSSYGSWTLTLVDFNVTSPIRALQSCVYAYFNVGFQPYIWQKDEHRPHKLHNNSGGRWMVARR